MIVLPVLLTLLVRCRTAQMPQAPVAPTTQPTVSIETHFSPQEEIAPTIVKLIDDAQNTLDVAAFSFTHPEIAAATIRAHERGVRVRIVMDTTSASARDSLVPKLAETGIPVQTRRKRGSQHSKYVVIDEAIVATGSYNFTTRADERNSENLVVIRNSPDAVRAFMQDFESLRADSIAYRPSARPRTRR